MLNLKKRDNDIIFRALSCGAGWLNIVMIFGDTEIPVKISCVMDAAFEDLVKKLYYLYPHQDNEEDQGENCIDEYSDCILPLSTSLQWDEEGTLVKWNIVRETTMDVDARLSITISHVIASPELFDEQFVANFNKQYSFEVGYINLCYAVAKFMTDVIKKYGFYGYFSSTYGADINIRQLLFLKAIALDCLQIRELTSSAEQKYDVFSNIEDEIELLLFDM